MVASQPLRAEIAYLTRPPLVLCVDDESRTLAALQRALRREPYEVVVVESPREALAWVDARDVSLLITDQRMPEMSGSELIEEVRGRSPGTLCMVLTAYPASVSSDEFGWMSVSEMLLKPWDDRQLRRIVRGLLEERGRGAREGSLDDPDFGGDGGSA